MATADQNEAGHGRGTGLIGSIDSSVRGCGTSTFPRWLLTWIDQAVSVSPNVPLGRGTSFLHELPSSAADARAPRSADESRQVRTGVRRGV